MDRPSQKYLVRRNLDAYSEIAFARYLAKTDVVLYFPFKDVGIDMIGLKGSRMEWYQLKARNGMLKNPDEYKFSIKSNMERLSKLNGNVYFILCALQPNQKDFHFFKIPWVVAAQYFKARGYKKSKFFEIKRLPTGKYKVYPTYIDIDVNRFWLK